jgi:hypothetical protein
VITQPAPSVSNRDVERIVLRDFPSEVARVLNILHEYGTEEWQREIDRVRLAALKMAAGSIDGLHSAIETAKIDYRDVLAIAEYPEYLRSVGLSDDISGEEKQRIIDADWKQYNEWLNR